MGIARGFGASTRGSLRDQGTSGVHVHVDVGIL